MKSIEARVDSFIRSGEGDFNRLACELFVHQCHANAAFGHYVATVCERWEEIKHWEEIPTLPIVAFKKSAVTTFSVTEARTIFHSSGTTSAEQSSHYFKTTDLYELSIIQGWPSRPSNRVRILAHSQTPEDAPDSSLIHMFQTLINHFGDPQSDFVQSHADLAELLSFSQKEGCPVWLLGTALALHRFLNYCEAQKISFSFESHLLAMETGGFKGLTEAIPWPHFYRRLRGTLGISMFSVLSEYGMCELSSQFYTRPGAEVRAFHAPPWVRWRVVHPLSGDPVPEGEKGVLEIFDLANVDSAFAIRTEDVAHSAEGGFVLDGRIRTAPQKGCSLTTRP